ncbi:MAG: outer membrane beta-barrel protein [Flavitalea sp.]
MKKLFILFVLFICVGFVKAQKSNSIALNGYAGYVFQESVEFDGFTEYAKEGFQYGIGLEFFFQRDFSLELKYLRQDTRLPLYGPGGEQLNEGSVNYFLLETTSYYGGITPQSKVWPYGGVGLGVGIVDSHDAQSAIKFAWDAKLGVQIKASSNVSFKLQATFQSIVSGMRSELHVSPGGSRLPVPDYDTLFQFGLAGGLCFTFK